MRQHAGSCHTDAGCLPLGYPSHSFRPDPVRAIAVGPPLEAIKIAVSGSAITRPGWQSDAEEGDGVVTDDMDVMTDDMEEYYTQFFIDHRQDLTSYATKLAGNVHDGKDAVDEAVLRSWEHYYANRTMCPEGRDLIGWLKTIIANRIISDYRHRKVVERGRARLTPTEPQDVAEEVLDSIVAEQGWEMVNSLGHPAREIAILRWGEGKEANEIAEILGMPPGTVRSSVHRTRRQLQHAFGITTSSTKSALDGDLQKSSSTERSRQQGREAGS